ncbi:MAG: ACP S-malonyltransferase [Myxococcales bacterium]|nr:ACP S-malonyltransferase [Myxococcales bacterium]
MPKTAFLFPGQGSQKVGMGRDIYDASPSARAVFDEADAVLEEALSLLCFDGPEESLNLTANTQPAILTVSIALCKALGKQPDVVAGHSLGEYSAHVVSGTLTFADAVRIVRKRGRYMQAAVPVGEGAMAAVLGANIEDVEHICELTHGVVSPANYNSPGQVVIAGETEAVARASEQLNALGAKVRPLPVSAPFHCALMLPAERALEADLRASRFLEPQCPIYVNVDGAPVSTGDAGREALIQQVSRSVRWQQTIERMLADGVEQFVEIGPGRVLTGLLSRIDKHARGISIQGPLDFDKLTN